MSQPVPCPYCKKEIRSDDDVCKYCGKDLRKKKRLLLYMGSVALCFVLPSVGLGAYRGYQYLENTRGIAHSEDLAESERYGEALATLDEALNSNPTVRQREAIRAKKASIQALKASEDEFEAGREKFDEGSCEEAVARLERVSPASSKYGRAKELISECGEKNLNSLRGKAVSLATTLKVDSEINGQPMVEVLAKADETYLRSFIEAYDPSIGPDAQKGSDVDRQARCERDKKDRQAQLLTEKLRDARRKVQDNGSALRQEEGRLAQSSSLSQRTKSEIQDRIRQLSADNAALNRSIVQYEVKLEAVNDCRLLSEQALKEL